MVMVIIIKITTIVYRVFLLMSFLVCIAICALEPKDFSLMLQEAKETKRNMS